MIPPSSAHLARRWPGPPECKVPAQDNSAILFATPCWNAPPPPGNLQATHPLGFPAHSSIHRPAARGQSQLRRTLAFQTPMEGPNIRASAFRLFSDFRRRLFEAVCDASWLEPQCWCRLAWDTLRNASHSRQPTGIHSADLREYPVDGLDCLPSASSGQALRGNDRRLDRDAIPNDIGTRRRSYLKKLALR
jgi:hypothetical protein